MASWENCAIPSLPMIYNAEGDGCDKTLDKVNTFEVRQYSANNTRVYLILRAKTQMYFKIFSILT